jgi:hypothetical protein
MYMEPGEAVVHPDDRSIFARGPFVAGSLLATAALTLIIGIWPQYFYLAALRTMSYVLPKI